MKQKFLNKNLVVYGRTFKLLVKSYLKSSETYLFLVAVPIVFSIFLYVFTSSFMSVSVRPPLIGSIILLPALSCVFLINTILADWKDSIIIKRIRTSGLTTSGFLLLFYLVNIVFIFIPITISLISVAIIDKIFNLDNLKEFFIQINNSPINYFGLFLSALFITLIGLSISILIVGQIKKRVYADIVLILILVFMLLTSDAMFDPIKMKKNLIYNLIGYINPIKYAVWSVFMFSSSSVTESLNIELIMPTDGYIFFNKWWQPFLSSFVLSTSITLISLVTFNINRK